MNINVIKIIPSPRIINGIERLHKKNLIISLSLVSCGDIIKSLFRKKMILPVVNDNTDPYIDAKISFLRSDLNFGLLNSEYAALKGNTIKPEITIIKQNKI